MNPQKEFIKALMSVLRLEQNIYTIAALEEITDRIKVDDYTIFIAYIGERESDFEKPIQSIANAVNEFYTMKSKPVVKRSTILRNGILSALNHSFHDMYCSDEFNDSEIENKIRLMVDKFKTIKSVVVEDGTSEHGIPNRAKLELVDCEKIINELGGLNSVVEIYIKNRKEIELKIKKLLDAKTILMPSITQKIENEASSNIDTKTLSVMKKLLKVSA